MQCRRHIEPGAYANHLPGLVQPDIPVPSQINGCHPDSLRDALFQHIAEPSCPGAPPFLFRRKVQTEKASSNREIHALKRNISLHKLPAVCSTDTSGVYSSLNSPSCRRALRISYFSSTFPRTNPHIPARAVRRIPRHPPYTEYQTKEYIVEPSYRRTFYFQKPVHQVHIILTDNPYRQFPVPVTGYIRPVIDRFVIFLYNRCRCSHNQPDYELILPFLPKPPHPPCLLLRGSYR